MIVHCESLRNPQYQRDYPKYYFEVFQFELLHEQLPLPVPCYDLLPVDELTVGPLARDFGYSHLP
jgi:hypothetical protein